MVTGRVTERANTLIIEVDLVRVADGSELWGEHYNRKLADILAVQEDIAREISQKLRLRLSGEEKKRLAKRYTEKRRGLPALPQGSLLCGQVHERELR